MALSLALLASAGVLAASLRDPAPALDTPAPGTLVAVHGALTPFALPAGHQWDAVARLLDRLTYAVATGADGALVLVTAATPPPSQAARGGPIQGLVLWEGPHPDDAARSLVLLQGAWAGAALQ